jgi:hypothetical protein
MNHPHHTWRRKPSLGVILFSAYLKFRMMDRVDKYRDSETIFMLLV